MEEDWVETAVTVKQCFATWLCPISTTLPKAKELRRTLEPLITLAKEDNASKRRMAFNKIRNKAAVGKLFKEIGPRFKDRPGGYLRILKKGSRPGDSAPMALVQLTDYEIENDENINDN